MANEVTQPVDHLHQTPPGLYIFALQGFHSRFGAGTYPFQTALDGRLLSEVRASEGAQEAATIIGTEPRERASKLPGTRRGLAENYAAFEAIGQRWQETLDALAWLNSQYFGESMDRPATLLDLKSLSLLGIYTASFLLNKADGYGPTGKLPNVVADMLKVCQGIYTAAMYMEGDSGEETAKPADISNAAEREKLLISIDYKACPAPLPMITISLESLLERKGNAAGSEMNTLISPADFQRLQAYTDYSQVYAALSSQLLDAASPFIESVTALTADQRAQYETILDAYVPEIARLQAAINTTLGRDPNTAPIINRYALAEFEGILVR